MRLTPSIIRPRIGTRKSISSRAPEPPSGEKLKSRSKKSIVRPSLIEPYKKARLASNTSKAPERVAEQASFSFCLATVRFVVPVHFACLKDPESSARRSDLRDDLTDRILRRHASARGVPGGAFRDASSPLRHCYPSAMAVTGCTSQIVGMRLFKLGGPGRCPVAWLMSKNSEPVIVTGMGGS